MTMTEKLHAIKAMESANDARLRKAGLKRAEDGDRVWYAMHGGRMCRFWYSKRTGVTVVYDLDGVVADAYGWEV